MKKEELEPLMKSLGYKLSPYFINQKYEEQICYVKYPAFPKLDIIEFVFNVKGEKIELVYYGLSDIYLKTDEDIRRVNKEYEDMRTDLRLLENALGC